ncbi:MAG: hypothetical protein M3Q14_03430 [bacterium]|nr:hypothetical protein [bacterium]
MTKDYIMSRPKKGAQLHYGDLLDDSGSDWHTKARALRMRRWRVLKKANKKLSEQMKW